jgi:DHA1 family multidrug resistance protein-like MFS transporter
MVVRAIFGLAISQALIGLSQNVWHLFAFRLVQGVISGFIASAIAFVSTTTPKARIGYALGLLASASAAGTVLGPAVGGLLADLIGYREIFFVTAALCTVGGFVVVFGVSESRKGDADGRSYRVLDNLRLMFSDPRLRTIGALFILGQMAVLMIEPLFALFIESFGTGTNYVATIAGGIFAISGLLMVIASPWWGRRNDRSGYRRNLTVAFAVTGICYGAHLLVSGLVQLSLLRALLGFARGGILPALYSLTNTYSPPERRSGMIAIASSLTIFGNLLGPMAGGAIAGQFGIAGTFVATAALLVACAALAWKHLDESGPTAEPVSSETTGQMA